MDMMNFYDVLDMVRICYGYAMDMLWICYGYGLDMICYGFDMVRICHGLDMLRLKRWSDVCYYGSSFIGPTHFLSPKDYGFPSLGV